MSCDGLLRSICMASALDPDCARVRGRQLRCQRSWGCQQDIFAVMNISHQETEVMGMKRSSITEDARLAERIGTDAWETIARKSCYLQGSIPSDIYRTPGTRRQHFA